MSNIQLGNYIIQQTQGGCLVRDNSGKIVFEAPTEQDAAAFIKEKMNKEESKHLTESRKWSDEIYTLEDVLDAIANNISDSALDRTLRVFQFITRKLNGSMRTVIEVILDASDGLGYEYLLTELSNSTNVKNIPGDGGGELHVMELTTDNGTITWIWERGNNGQDHYYFKNEDEINQAQERCEQQWDKENDLSNMDEAKLIEATKLNYTLSTLGDIMNTFGDDELAANLDMYKYIAGQLGIKRMEFIVIPQFNSTIKDLLSEENVLIRNKKFNNGSTVESCLVERTYFPILYCMELKGNNVAYYFQSDVDVKDLINYLTEIQGKEE